MRIEEKPRLQVAPFDEAGWRELLAKWAHSWDADGLDREVRIVVSQRMRVTLGVYAYREREIRIAAFLLDAPPLFLQEVVCHEFAHAAIHAREAKSLEGGHDVDRSAPHGSAWRLLMRKAGWIPRARIPRGELDRLLPIHASKRVMWRHRCPKCQGERLAGRPVREWRCRNCSWFGIGGRLEVERLGASD
jgi:predicted SprT family Zn-dependent metalloprotease